MKPFNITAINIEETTLVYPYYLIFGLLIIIMIVIPFSNILVILTIYYTAKLRRVRSMYIANLAVADLLLGIWVLISVFVLFFYVSFWLSTRFTGIIYYKSTLLLLLNYVLPYRRKF